MKKLTLPAIAVFIIVLNIVTYSQETAQSDGKILSIQWQRLINEEGHTCARCTQTESEIKEAVEKLEGSLEPLGFQVEYKELAITKEAFENDPLQSNSLYLAEKPLEDWLGAQVGKSACSQECAVAGKPMECRTLIYNGNTYEVVPSDLIIKASMMAAAEMMNPPSESDPGPKVSCPMRKTGCIKSKSSAAPPCRTSPSTKNTEETE